MPQTRGAFGQLYDNTERRVYVMLAKQLKQLKPVWRDVYNIEDSDRQTEISLGVVGFDDVPEKPEGSAYAEAILRPGHQKQITHTTFGYSFVVTQEAKEDDRYGQIAKAAMWFMFSAKYVQEKRAANVWLNNAFTTETTADGLSAFNTAHVLAGGSGTFRNRPTTDVALSWNSLRDAITDLSRETKHDSGQRAMAVEDLYLCVPPELEMLATRIIESPNLPQSADNDINAVKVRRGLKLVVNPEFTSTSAWCLLPQSKAMHGLKAFERVPITIQETRTDPNTGNTLTPVRFRYSWFWETAQQSWGTAGA